MTLRIKGWHAHFENSESRKLKKLSWVPVPNKMDGEGYTTLVDHPNGAAHLGAWLAIMEIASKQEPREARGQLPGGPSHDIGMIAKSLGRISRLPAALFEEVLPRLTAAPIAWVEVLSNEQTARIPGESTDVPGENPGVSGGSADISGANRIEQNRTEEKDKPLSSIGIDGEIITAREAVELSKGRPKKPWFDHQHEIWYQAFWCHKGKSESRKALERAINRMVDREACLYNVAIAFLVESVHADRARFENTQDWEWRVNLHPATWLNQERWTDEPGPEVSKLTVNQERHQQTRDAMKLLDRMEEIG